MVIYIDINTFQWKINWNMFSSSSAFYICIRFCTLILVLCYTWYFYRRFRHLKWKVLAHYQYRTSIFWSIQTIGKLIKENNRPSLKLNFYAGKQRFVITKIDSLLWSRWIVIVRKWPFIPLLWKVIDMVRSEHNEETN